MRFLLVWLVVLVAGAGAGRVRRGRRGAGRTGDRAVLLGMVRDLSEGLQATLATSQQRVDGVAEEQDRLGLELGQIRGEVESMVELVEGVVGSKEEVMRRVDGLEERVAMDQLVWKFNSEVCNTSIQLVKEEVVSRLTMLEERGITTLVEEEEDGKVAVGKVEVTTTTNPMDFFKKFESALMEYDDEYDEYDYGEVEGGEVRQEQEEQEEEGVLQVQQKISNTNFCHLPLPGIFSLPIIP